MGLPAAAEARLYYRAARQRYEDALLLLEAGRTTGAVYMAGYTVECYLKALILSAVAARVRAEILGKFRGNRAHDIEWLSVLYRQTTQVNVPREVAKHLSRTATWTTDLRYSSSAPKRRDADAFVESVTAIMAWADGRM
ncbi:MAG: HEPN domain-containing protein [Planctomycetia bacterium]|nr:HEPN domain-containing protein [Planctomycetia bacterium]